MSLSKALIWCMTTERNCNDRSGIYGFTQRALAYNSNKIEGSTLTEDQTAALFEEGFLPTSEKVYRAKDIEEMNGHFLMFNKMLAMIDEPLSEGLIKDFHYELKAGVFEDRANGYAIGDYKKRANIVNNLDTAHPKDVAEEMGKLMNWYHSVENKSLDTIAMLHSSYELIHPFQDGNGRTGRIIIFRECLTNNICPFIVQDKNRDAYITSLKKAQAENDYSDLVKYFESEQSEYSERCQYFSVEDRYSEQVYKDRFGGLGKMTGKGLPSEFEKIVELAEELVKSNPSAQQVFTVLTAKGSVRWFVNHDVDSGSVADEAAFVRNLVESGDTKIRYAVCMWSDYTLDVPSHHLRELLTEIDSLNRETQFLLKGAEGFSVKALKTMCPPKR